MQVRKCLVMIAALVTGILLRPVRTNADTITNFFVEGTYGLTPPFTAAFSGLLTVDVTTGTLTAIDVSFPGSSPAIPNFNQIQTSTTFGPTYIWLLEATNVSGDWFVLNFNINSAGGTLVGLTGGTITGGSLQHAPPPATPYLYIDSGRFFIPSAELAPEPSSFALWTLGFLAGILLLRQRTKGSAAKRSPRLSYDQSPSSRR